MRWFERWILLSIALIGAWSIGGGTLWLLVPQSQQGNLGFAGYVGIAAIPTLLAATVARRWFRRSEIVAAVLGLLLAPVGLFIGFAIASDMVGAGGISDADLGTRYLGALVGGVLSALGPSALLRLIQKRKEIADRPQTPP